MIIFNKDSVLDRGTVVQGLDFAGSAGGHPAAAHYPVVSSLAPIGVQALDIITAILDDPSPGLADIQLRLRGCLADYPRHPEHALLAHLVLTMGMVNWQDGTGFFTDELVGDGEYP